MMIDEVFAHLISIFRLYLSDLTVKLMAVLQPSVMSDSYLRILHLISHQLLEHPSIDLVVPVELVREDMFAHTIYTVPIVPVLLVADHRIGIGIC